MISSSQPETNVESDRDEVFNATQSSSLCVHCNRTFRTERGLKQHSNKCKGKRPLRVITEDVTGKVENRLYHQQVTDAFDKIVFWRKNLFDLPKGSTGKDFITEMTRLINNWNNKGSEYEVSLTALSVMPMLILQRTSMKSKTSDIKQHLERRLQMWKDRKIDELVEECSTIQERLMGKILAKNNT